MIYLLYYISNKDLLVECYKEQNVTVTGAANASLLKQKTVKHFAHCHVFAQSPPGRPPVIISGQPFTSLQICVKMFHCCVIW